VDAIAGGTKERRKEMFGKLMRTDDSVASLVLRLALGVAILAHGAQKVLGWFGGYGLSGTWGWMTGTVGIPALFAALAIIAEFAGSLGLIVGLLGRVAAFGIACNMAVAAIVGGHIHNGFFINWSGSQKGEGVEFHLLAVGIAIALMIRGSGALSLDRLFTRSKQ
jgi:putative oxidoreductase